jgi:hypothetical protein
LINFRRSAKKETETVYDQVVNISICKQNKQLNVVSFIGCALLLLLFPSHAILDGRSQERIERGGKTMGKQEKLEEKHK